VLVDFLRSNADIFAWSPSDMPGIPREVAEHSLDILLLRPKVGIGKRLTCGLSLVRKYHSAGNFPQRIR
jgi:hypothetical protein